MEPVYNTNELIYETEEDSQTHRTDLWSPREREEGEGWTWSSGLVDANYYIFKRINNKVLLYSTENYIQYPIINHNEKEYEKEYVAAPQKLT